MSEQTVRERIAEAVYDGRDGDLAEECDAATDRIVQIIREAMLTPSVVKAAHKGVPPPVQIKRVLTNALNEVFGTE